MVIRKNITIDSPRNPHSYGGHDHESRDEENPDDAPDDCPVGDADAGDPAGGSRRGADRFGGGGGGEPPAPGAGFHACSGGERARDRDASGQRHRRGSARRRLQLPPAVRWHGGRHRLRGRRHRRDSPPPGRGGRGGAGRARVWPVGARADDPRRRALHRAERHRARGVDLRLAGQLRGHLRAAERPCPDQQDGGRALRRRR